MIAALLLFWAVQQQPEEIYRQAIELQKSGNFAGAVAKYREFLQIVPDAIPIRSNLGVALAQLGRFDEAIAEYETALKQDPANNGIALNLALAYYKTGRIPEAAKQLTELHRRAPAETQTTLLLADCQLRMGKKHGGDSAFTGARLRRGLESRRRLHARDGFDSGQPRAGGPASDR